MEVIKSTSVAKFPVGFTGIVESDHDRIIAYVKDGKFHREKGPAIIYENHYFEWWLNGKRHRADGPAIEFCDGGKVWLLNGTYFKSKEDWFNALTSEQKENALWNISLWKP